MNTTLNNERQVHENALTTDPNRAFILKLNHLVAQLHQNLNAGQLDPSTVVGLGVCAVQLDGLSTCLFTDSAEKPVNPGIRLASAVLAICLQQEDNPRVTLLLNKAHKLTEQALKIRTGEIITSTLH